MSDVLKQFVTVSDARRQVREVMDTARAIAKDYDRRRRIAAKALRGIDTYAWSMVTVPGAPGRRELQKRIDACRKALAEI